MLGHMDAKHEKEYYIEDPGDINQYLIGAEYLYLRSVDDPLTGYTIISTDKGRIGIAGFQKDQGFCFRTSIGEFYFQKGSNTKQLNVMLNDDIVIHLGSNKLKHLFHDVFITKDGRKYKVYSRTPMKSNIHRWYKIENANGDEIISVVTYIVVKQKDRQLLHKINIKTPLEIENNILFGMLPSLINTLILF